MIDLRTRIRRGAFAMDVELHLHARATGVFGRSGAGKSTLLHALAGLVPADTQRLAIADAVIDDGARRTPVHRRGIAVVFQEHRLFPHHSIERNLRYGERAGPVRFADLIDLLELAPLLARRPAQCSLGECQRVALGRALLTQPRLLLLDEPLSSLDRGLKRQILPFLRRLRHICPAPIIHVSHDLDELLAVTDELLLLDQGRIVAQGSFSALADQPEALALLHDQGLVNVLPATVVGHDDEDGISRLALGGLVDGLLGGLKDSHFSVARCPFAIGTAVELLLRPADLAIACGEPGAISLGGRHPARISAMTTMPGRVMLRLDLGGVDVLAEVAPRSVRALGLHVGANVTALWKVQAAQVRER
jgi:molybdate transport system ATP-binding protein